MKWENFEKYEAIGDYFPMGILCFSIEKPFYIKYANEKVLELLGFDTVEEMKNLFGSSLLSGIHNDDLDKVSKLIDEVKQGSDKSLVIRLRMKDFSYRWVMISAKSLKENYMIMTLFDYSKQQEQLESLELTNQNILRDKRTYQTLLDDIPGGVYIFRLFDPMNIEFVSEGLCRMSGHSGAELKSEFGNNYEELIIAEDKEIFISTLKLLREYPHTETIRYRMRRKDGSVSWVIDTLRSVRLSDGNMWAFAVVQNLQNAHVAIDNVDMKKVIEYIPIGMIAYEYVNNKIQGVEINDALCNMIGCNKSECISVMLESPYNMVLVSDRDRVGELFGRLKANETTEIECDARMATIEGAKWVKIKAYQQVQSQREKKLVIFVQDMTAQKELEDIKLIEKKKMEGEKQIRIQTFGSFQVFVDGEPIHFRSEKARELLAVLVDWGGGYVTQGTLIGILWENESANTTTMSRCRKTYKTLVDELKRYGIGHIVESKRGGRRIIIDEVECDLFDFKMDKPGALDNFFGSYMMEYSWAETTLAELISKNNK